MSYCLACVQKFCNHWIDLHLTGAPSNKAAIGAKIRVSFVDNGVRRSLYRM